MVSYLLNASCFRRCWNVILGIFICPALYTFCVFFCSITCFSVLFTIIILVSGYLFNVSDPYTVICCTKKKSLELWQDCSCSEKRGKVSKLMIGLVFLTCTGWEQVIIHFNPDKWIISFQLSELDWHRNQIQWYLG